MHFLKRAFAVLFIISVLGVGPVSYDVNAGGSDINKVSVTINGDTTNAKGFTWYTGPDSVNSDLEVVEAAMGEPDYSKAIKFSGDYYKATNSPLENVHKVQATGLKPGTSYFYRVGDAKSNKWSDTGTFKTAAGSGAFTFINLTDTQSFDENEAKLSSQTIEKSLSTVKNSEFMMVNGDFVEYGPDEYLWDWLWKYSKSGFLNSTVVPTAGNHECLNYAFIDHFNLKQPNKADTMAGAYYSYDYSNAHFIVLNTNEYSEEYSDLTSEQVQWMKDDVKKARANGAKWIIIQMHKGPYTTSTHATDYDIMEPYGVRATVAPIIEELGVDLVLQGHDHIYARTKPIKDGEAKNVGISQEKLNDKTVEYMVQPKGTVYVIPGTAGAKVYYKNTYFDNGFFDLFEIADEHHAAIYGKDPINMSSPLFGQVQNFMGITIDGNKLTAVAYEIDQNKDNGKPYIIDQFGIIKSNNESKGISQKDIYADTNDDGIIDSADYTTLRKYLLGIITSFPSKEKGYGDLNLDGNIDSLDYVLLKMYILEMLDKLPF